MKETVILWVDDEIDLLKPHVIFLETKGYKIDTANNGNDAIELVAKNAYDLVFLDENMPGLSGLETLSRIKDIRSNLPVIMITKSEEETIMEEAIGSKIDDYLIKPVNPKQILMAIKKITDQKRLVSQKTTSNYQQQFAQLGLMINDSLKAEDWKSIYKKLSFWEMELQQSGAEGMDQVLQMQKEEANKNFSRFVKKYYADWFAKPSEDTPLLSPNVFKNYIFPALNDRNPLVVIVIDNLRFDQWKAIEPMINEVYETRSEDMYFSILPTATQFARNALFAGLMPSEIEKIHPGLWVNEDEEGGKNQYEEELLQKQMNRLGIKSGLFFDKIANLDKSRKLLNNINEMMQNQLSVLVINFVDMLSHARTEMEMIRELAADEAAYRSLTQSWFEHSSLFELIKILAAKKIRIMITTDHGTIRVSNPIKVIGDKNVSTNLRYKQGKSMNYNPKEVFEVKNPQSIFLPKLNVSTSYIFACNDDFFAYPNNYNHYVSYYRNTFQHGGISMEEMIIPLITLEPK
jgi:CheY-like chemotaxis protein